MNEQNELLNSIKTTLGVFASYTRQYNREGRREQERRDADQKREREEDIQGFDNIQFGQASKRCRVSDENVKEKPRAIKVLGRSSHKTRNKQVNLTELISELCLVTKWTEIRMNGLFNRIHA